MMDAAKIPSARIPSSDEWLDWYGYYRDLGCEPGEARYLAREETRDRTAGNRSAFAREYRPFVPQGDWRDPDCIRSYSSNPSEQLDIEASLSWKFAIDAERIASDIMEGETGAVVSPEKYEKRLSEKERSRDAATVICGALERVGVPMWRHDAWSLWRYNLHSALLEELPAYRRVCLNPYIAAMTRSSKLSALEYFLSLYEPWQYRFWTFTSGERCKHFQLRERCEWLFRKLSKLNALLKKRGFPVEFVFRACEFGTLEDGKRKGSGGSVQRRGRHVFYHPHIHTVLFVREFVSEGRWQLMLSIVRDFWQRDGKRLHWDAGKMIGNARECVKYVTKPGDMVWLAQHKPLELKNLFDATLGLRMVTPLGGLKRQIRARKQAGTMLVRVTTGDGCIWREIKDPDSPFWQDDHTDRERASLRAAQEEARSRRQSEREHIRVVKRCMPTVGPDRVKEPTVLVMANTENRADILAYVSKHPLVARIRHHTAAAYAAGLALARTDFEGLARERVGALAGVGLDQGSHGHINCPADECWPPPPLEIDHDYIPEADENPIFAN